MELAERFSTLGFIGAGNMAGAIIRAVAGGGLIDPSACAVTDVIAGKAQALADELGVKAVADSKELVDSCANVVLATKPQDIGGVLETISGAIGPEHLIISIAAGIPTKSIESALPSGTRVVRVMPNTPALIGEGAAAVAGGANATPDDVRSVCALFEAVGVAAEADESDLDAVTALSGSGPAYVFRFIEIIQSAGEELGLDPELARRLTLQTFLGAARLAIESEDSPAELRRRVTSPGGTTAAALDVFERGGLEALIKEGLRAARDRSIELASEK